MVRCLKYIFNIIYQLYEDTKIYKWCYTFEIVLFIIVENEQNMSLDDSDIDTG